MKADLARLARLHRLERVRAIAKQTAASEAARAESTLSQLSQLAERTQALAADYAARTDLGDGADLRRLGHFQRGLAGVRASAEADVARARAIADRRQAELASAERRRAAVEDRARATRREIDAKREAPALGSRRGFGTGLE